MKLKKLSLLIATSILLGNYVAPIGLASTVHADSLVKADNTSEVISQQPFEKMVEDGYLETDVNTKKVLITEKYKQEVLSSVDTNVYDVRFTENSVTISPIFSPRAFTGVSKVVYTWKGIDIYLDNVRANKLAAALAVGAEVVALAGLVPASAVGAIIGEIFAIGSGLVWYNNAAGRGIIIGCIGQFPHAKAHWITSQ